jgi:hypothetical protein
VVVVLRIARGIGPQVIGPDWRGPSVGPFDPVGPIQHPDNAVYSARCRAVPLAFVGLNAAFSDGAGVCVPTIPDPLRR